MFKPQPKIFKPKKAKKPLSKARKATGEMETFEAVIAELPDTVTKCFVCDERITLVTHSNFAHVISKGKYEKARLDPNNIKILCHKIIVDENGQGCHYQWDMRPRSEIVNNPMWEKMFILEKELKEKYKTNL